MAIRIFITGGTIDKVRLGPPHVGYKAQRSFIHEMLKQSLVKLSVSIDHLLNKSSREITAGNRKLMASKCMLAKEDQILITHGTITMSETAKYLAKHVKGKTIVLTGSMVPYKVKDSDALFNLGAAFTAVQTLPPGVYVCMHGEIYQYNYRHYRH